MEVFSLPAGGHGPKGADRERRRYPYPLSLSPSLSFWPPGKVRSNKCSTDGTFEQSDVRTFEGFKDLQHRCAGRLQTNKDQVEETLPRLTPSCRQKISDAQKWIGASKKNVEHPTIAFGHQKKQFWISNFGNLMAILFLELGGCTLRNPALTCTKQGSSWQGLACLTPTCCHT